MTSNRVDKEKVIRESSLFDADWYLRNNPDVARRGVDPARHYLQHGGFERRDPSPWFVSEEYRVLHFDVRHAKVNPLYHYEMHGRHERRPVSYSQFAEPVFPESAVECERTFGISSRRIGRTVVFASFSGNGRISDEVLFYLHGLREIADNIVFVADCPVLESEIGKLSGLVAHALFIRHREYDFGSYKRGYACAERLGLLKDTDELVLANDSCYAPVFPLKEVFGVMAARVCDFWGMTINVGMGIKHIQSFFMVFRRGPLMSGDVAAFLSTVGPCSDRAQVIVKYELRFTAFLVKRGYSCDSYLPPGGVKGNPMKCPLQTMRAFRFPLLKVKTIGGDCREPISEVIDYVRSVNPELGGLLREPREDPGLLPFPIEAEHYLSFSCRLHKIAEKVKSGDQLKVLFLALDEDSFTSEALFASMKKDPAFEPIVYVIPDVRQERCVRGQMENAYRTLVKTCGKDFVAMAKQDDLGAWCDVCVDADIVVYPDPSDASVFRFNARYSVGRRFLPLMFVGKEGNFAFQTYAWCWKVLFVNRKRAEKYAEQSVTRGDNAVVLGNEDVALPWLMRSLGLATDDVEAEEPWDVDPAEWHVAIGGGTSSPEVEAEIAEIGVAKKLRGLAKQIIPYGIESAYRRKRYGIIDCRVRKRGFLGWIANAVENALPFGLVNRWAEDQAKLARMPLQEQAVRLGLFDSEWYVHQREGIVLREMSAWDHYVNVGWRDGLDPSPHFSTGGYLARNIDIQVADTNPLLHYLRFGRREGRVTGSLAPFCQDMPTKADRRACARKEKNPLISVVVASYNYETLVLETLESLVAQTYRNFEVVVVDDGSSDRSRENIRAFISAHPETRITLYTHPGAENRGLAATVRLGVEACKGEFVAFCESDDTWTCDHLEQAVALINTYADPKVIVNDVDIFGDPAGVFRAEGNRLLRYCLLRHTRNFIPPAEFRRMNYILTFSACMVKRSELLRCDYHPDAHPAALDWWLWRQVCFDNDIYFIDRKLTLWRMHDSYLVKTRNAKNQPKTNEQRDRELMKACDAVIRRQHPFSLVARALRAPQTLQGPGYCFKAGKRAALRRDRGKGISESRGLVLKNAGRARILVCLHLFYGDAWPIIVEYLRALQPYRHVDYLVTYVEGLLEKSVLDQVRGFAPQAKFVAYPNNGFDIGPFVASLRDVDLDRYDIVFKLQSKGVRRRFIYIYDQVFKWADWFFNLYDGVLNGRTTHRDIDALLDNRVDLVAADNLIVKDPKHKQSFVRTFCEQRGLPYVENYRFVAGTCFAVRAEALKPLQALNLGIEDFADTVRGEFSLAHSLERWMCFAANGRIQGNVVVHNEYPEEVEKLARTSAIRLLDDPCFKLDYEFFYRVLEMRRIRSYSVVALRLGDICRRWVDGKLYPLSECAPYKYLNGDRAAYDAYCAQNRELSGFEMSVARFDRLKEDMIEYDQLSMPVVHGKANLLLDGQHRSCILLDRHGPDHVISVLRLEY